MKKILLASSALATVALAAPVMAADVTVSGGVEWRYTSVSDDADNETRASNSSFQSTQDVTISFASTSDSGLSMALSANFGDDAVGTMSSSISGDFGTIEWSEASGSAHAASTYDVTSGGVAGGHGDGGFTLYNGLGAPVDKVGHDEAQINDPENGVLNYHSPTFNGFSFGVGISHLTHADDNSSTSFGAKYSGEAGMMGDFKYSIGYASYDGAGDDVGGSHIGGTLTSGALTLGYGQASNDDGSDEEDVVSYSATYELSDDLKLNVGHAISEYAQEEATNTTVGIAYSIVPGLTFSLSSHSFEYTNGDFADQQNEGSAIQSELKMSF